MNRSVDPVADVGVALQARDLELVAFDLDGVITRTARVHAKAWKTVFDAFLDTCEHGDRRPFDDCGDYLTHVDGKPRLDGVRDFLAARGIDLPHGDPQDAPGTPTLWGIGNAKNSAFIDHLERDGVETYAPAVALLGRLADCGIRCAVVSASRNCRRVLAAAGLLDKVDTVVDGTDAAREGLAGKPAPDTFLAACARWRIPPARAAVIEDAEAGVAAGRAGGFRLVIGVDRADHTVALRAAGASHVVRSLDALVPEPLPSPLGAFDEIAARIHGRRPLVLLDYDGTLTPIVARPEDALLSAQMRATLAALARRCTVALVSGRGLDVLRQLAAIDALIYVSDHGFQVQLPGAAPLLPEAVARFEDVITEVTATLRERLGSTAGVLVEAKRFSVAVHYRLVADHAVADVRRVVDEALRATSGLRLLEGKKVWEVQPDVSWDKGAAVDWLLAHLQVDAACAIYVGDDVTDESAFRTLQGRATTIAVQSAPQPTAAGYRVSDIGEVQAFLDRLTTLTTRGKGP